MNTKQVIVFRKDLLKGDHSLRKGKIAAQVAHASLGSLLTLFDKTIAYHYERDDFDKCNIDEDQPIYNYSTSFTQDSILYNWLNGQFTKIVVGIDSEEELLELKKRLDETCIPHKLITDAGNTEFHGIPTVTCLGIGPYISEEIDKFTGNLPLL